ncbi:Hypothetical protein PHPALM_13401 [Phytophthora palmivora]|uniref:Centrosomal protein 20 n=1 Tax=Phytophthora palmivora TaxID=4796 RepID=A0A2P4XXC4_9STRA|nr:Hypothetical protein PHPALM_13401 [Phytophthora palmivora]
MWFVVLKDTLAARGSLDQIKARIRAEIFAALDDQDVPKPKLSNENLIINELIREYLEYNGYRHALSVFLPESGQPVEKPFDRQFLSSELNVTEDPRFTHVPLLYSIVASLQQNRSTTNLYSTAVNKPLTDHHCDIIDQEQQRARDLDVENQFNQFAPMSVHENHEVRLH